MRRLTAPPLGFRRLALAGAAIAGLLGACGREPPSGAPSAAEIRRAFAGSPAPLAALHAQGAALLGGGTAGMRRELLGLRGYPVVINKWGSWCGPCRAEFPFFQHQAVRFGRRVAFLGLDGADNHDDARGFLRRFPVTYPSFEDPREEIARALHAPNAYPETLFLDRAGRVSFIHQGAYPTESKLADDIRRYAAAP